MEVTKDLMEKSLLFLSQSDEEFARLKALTQGLDEQKKIVKAASFLRGGGTSAAQNEQIALNSQDYRQHIDKWHDANLNFLTLQAKRHTAEITIDCWRSLNAARNRQQIV